MHNLSLNNDKIKKSAIPDFSAVFCFENCFVCGQNIFSHTGNVLSTLTFQKHKITLFTCELKERQ